MDELTDPGPSRETRLSYAPDPRLTALSGAGAVVALAVAFTAADPAGRLLLSLAAVLLAAYTVTDLVFRPRLVLDAAGVRVHSPTGRAQLAWAQVERIEADTRLRFGLRSTTLEVDAGPVLLVLSRRALGADPADVAALARALRPR